MATQDRSDLMARHAEARARRERAVLGSDDYREAAEEVACIEVAIAAREEPSPAKPGTTSGSTTEPTAG